MYCDCKKIFVWSLQWKHTFWGPKNPKKWFWTNVLLVFVVVCAWTQEAIENCTRPILFKSSHTTCTLGLNSCKKNCSEQLQNLTTVLAKNSNGWVALDRKIGQTPFLRSADQLHPLDQLLRIWYTWKSFWYHILYFTNTLLCLPTTLVVWLQEYKGRGGIR